MTDIKTKLIEASTAMIDMRRRLDEPEGTLDSDHLRNLQGLARDIAKIADTLMVAIAQDADVGDLPRGEQFATCCERVTMNELIACIEAKARALEFVGS